MSEKNDPIPDDVQTPSDPNNIWTNFGHLVNNLKDIKEMLLIAAFFGGAIVWTIHYYATHEELETLECQTKLQVRMLQSTSNSNYTEQLAKQGRIELRDQEYVLRKAQNSIDKDDTEVKATQARIEDINLQQKSFQNIRFECISIV